MMHSSISTLVHGPAEPTDSLTRGFESVSRGIGWFAIALPLVCLFAAYWGLVPPEILRDSISHFYYVPIMGDAFVGILFFIGIMLLFFFHTKGNQVAGWGNLNMVETLMLRVAGIASMMVAVFPTLGQGGPMAQGALYRTFMPAKESTGLVGNFGYVESFLLTIPALGPLKAFSIPLHAVSAITMFAILAYFTLVVFTRPQRPESEIKIDGELQKTKLKRTRNIVYVCLGLVILISVAAIAYNFISESRCSPNCPTGPTAWQNANWTFWLELIVLLAFGIAWLIKGRAIGILNDPV